MVVSVSLLHALPTLVDLAFAIIIVIVMVLRL